MRWGPTGPPNGLEAALFVAIATLICGSIVHDPGRLALGHPGNDVWNHLWGYWWVGRSLAEGEFPLHTELLAWPTGGALWFIDTFNALLTLPVQWAAGPVAAYNLGIWLNLLLCGAGACALAWVVTGSRPGAAVAGVAYMTTPHLLGQIYNGISETVGAGWLPLALLTMRQAARLPSFRSGAVAGGVVGVTALANWYYGLFAGIVFGGLCFRAMVVGMQRLPTRRHIRATAGALGAGAFTAGLVAAPALWLFRTTMSAADALVTRDPDFVWRSLVLHNMTDLAAVILPGGGASDPLGAEFGENLIAVVYLGGTLLLPAAWVTVSHLRVRAAPWILLFLVFLLLSLGPFLYVAGQYVSWGGAWVPLPFLWLFEWFPAFGRISHAYRFSLGASLALAILAAIAVRHAPRWGVRAGYAAVLLGSARIVESLLLAPGEWPIPTSQVTIPSVYSRLTGGAVIELPVTQPVLERSRVLVNQFAHGAPIPFGLNDPFPVFLHANHYTRFLVELERREITYLPAALPLLDLLVAKEDLVARGARWVAVRRDGYDGYQYTRVAGFLDLTAVAVAEEEGVRVYDLTASR